MELGGVARLMKQKGPWSSCSGGGLFPFRPSMDSIHSPCNCWQPSQGLPREVEHPFVAHPICTTDQGPNVPVSQPLLD